MQEEITRQTITLSIQATRLTATTLQKAFHQLLAARAKQKGKLYKGKQTMRHLMKQGKSVSNIEVTKDNIKAFEHTAKKYGVDFALKKDISTKPPHYLVFFKGGDVDAITAAFKEFSAKNLAREKKPSIRKLLAKAIAKSKQKAQTQTKTKTKNREREL